ncbi:MULTISPECIES: STAS domain-containing protein [unclassified Streptomyces]|uniref:STAS domain-containing protein n=1 Tax=unclassified Streptomyces TaxID=2593676 RepID=UPI002252B34C|nr:MULTISPECIES: STAS domain-containing protein [unclassified Streptomyces]MCX4527686.1 STAS domain-containing protein [Streptomyces sp. NBC_01551]MCX4541716.1 STAS domain-containing protein [Streptomyces sp. NBC_01565]
MEITRLALPGPSPTTQDADRLCARLSRLYEDGARTVVCDAAAVTAPGLGAVEVLARLRFAARGRPLHVTGAGPALRALLDLVGLVELLGEPEEGEPPRGVQEGVEPDDLAV